MCSLRVRPNNKAEALNSFSSVVLMLICLVSTESPFFTKERLFEVWAALRSVCLALTRAKKKEYYCGVKVLCQANLLGPNGVVLHHDKVETMNLPSSGPPGMPEFDGLTRSLRSGRPCKGVLKRAGIMGGHERAANQGFWDSH